MRFNRKIYMAPDSFDNLSFGSEFWRYRKAISLLTCHGAAPVDLACGIRMRTDTEAVVARLRANMAVPVQFPRHGRRRTWAVHRPRGNPSNFRHDIPPGLPAVGSHDGSERISAGTSTTISIAATTMRLRRRGLWRIRSQSRSNFPATTRWAIRWTKRLRQHGERGSGSCGWNRRARR